MKVCKQVVEELFSVGETFPCREVDERALRIVSIDEDQVHVQSVLPAAGSAVLEFGAVSSAVDAAGGAAGDQPEGDALRCFVAEYLRRAEQARRDAEVDAMWQRAGACQL